MLSTPPRSPALIAATLLVSAINPHYFVPALVLFAAAREWRGILYGMFFVGVLGALAILSYGSDILIQYPMTLSAYLSGMDFPWFCNPLDIAHYLPVSHAISVSLGAIFAVVITAVSVWAGSTHMAAYLPLIYIFFSPYVSSYEMVLVMIPAVVLCQGKRFKENAERGAERAAVPRPSGSPACIQKRDCV